MLTDQRGIYIYIKIAKDGVKTSLIICFNYDYMFAKKRNEGINNHVPSVLHNGRIKWITKV